MWEEAKSKSKKNDKGSIYCESKKVKIKYNACGTVFEQTANNHLNRQGCPKCNSSHLETGTRILLEKNGIDFEAEKPFLG